MRGISKVVCRSALAVAVVALGAAGGASGATAASAGSAHYGHAGRWLTDGAGRVRVLHGFNMMNKLAGSRYRPDAVGFGDDDAAFLARHGFDVVRLGIIWKGLEPQPGQFDDAYLDSIFKTYETLRRHGLAVLLDFHQDMYNERFEGEGAPDWAVLGQAATEDPVPQLGFPANYVFQAALNHAYDAFWANTIVPGTGQGVQDLYAAAWAHVAQRFAGQPGIVGYNLLNEPWPGTIGMERVATGCATSPDSCGVKDFEAGPLTAFHRRVLQAIRRVDRRTVVYAAPLLVFDFGFASGVGRLDRRAGFAFNAYCAKASGQDAVIPFLKDKTCRQAAELSFANAEAVSRRTGQALFMTEFGSGDAAHWWRDYLDGADRHMISWAEWAYCGCGDPTGGGDSQALVLDPAKPLTGANVKTAKLRQLARPHPRVVAGTPIRWSWTASSRTFRFTYAPRRAGGGRAFGAGSATEVAVPALLFPSGYGVRVHGARVVSKADAPTLTLARCAGVSQVRVTVAPGRTRAAARRCR